MIYRQFFMKCDSFMTFQYDISMIWKEIKRLREKKPVFSHICGNSKNNKNYVKKIKKVTHENFFLLGHPFYI